LTMTRSESGVPVKGLPGLGLTMTRSEPGVSGKKCARMTTLLHADSVKTVLWTRQAVHGCAKYAALYGKDAAMSMLWQKHAVAWDDEVCGLCQTCILSFMSRPKAVGWLKLPV